MKGLSRILESAPNAEWVQVLEATYIWGFEIGVHEANLEAISFFDQNEYLGCIEAEMLLMKVPDGDPAWKAPSVEACNELVDENFRNVQIPGAEFEEARLTSVRQAASMGPGASSLVIRALEEGYAAGVLTNREKDPKLDVLEQGFRTGCFGTLQRRGAEKMPEDVLNAMAEACNQAAQDAVAQYQEILRQMQTNRNPG